MDGDEPKVCDPGRKNRIDRFCAFEPFEKGSNLFRDILCWRRLKVNIFAADRSGSVRIGAANQTISATLADASVSAALHVDIGSPILRVSRTVLDVTGRPVQHILAQFRPDRYQIRLDLTSPKLEPQVR